MKELSNFELLRKLKKDDTLRFGQWLWNLIESGFEPKPVGFFDTNIAIADKLWGIQDDELVKLIWGNMGRNNAN